MWRFFVSLKSKPMEMVMPTDYPRLIVFASGSKDGGGSGFANLIKAQRENMLRYNVVAVVSNHENGGVRKHADTLGVPFLHFPGPFEMAEYKRIVRWFNARFVSLSGWLKHVVGLDSRTCFNIHPCILPEFGGPGMYGHHVHEAALNAFREGRLEHSAVCMHFVTEQYDRGPVFFQHDVPIMANDSADSLGERVNKSEHRFQPLITDMVVRGMISWDGQNPDSLKVPSRYPFLPKGICA